MAFDFPNSPTNGQIFSPVGGPKYVYNAPSGVWLVQTGATNTAYVAKSGDVMTGPLTVPTIDTTMDIGTF